MPCTDGAQCGCCVKFDDGAHAMNLTEVPVWMTCQGDSLLGILSRPDSASALGMVIVVGGPQYRVGSHRQFLLLARFLARAGFAVFRFDCRGMGDSQGVASGFESIGDDIAVAIDTLQQACPAVKQVVLWGLCDGASAALLYSGQRDDARLVGLCLLNPWVRSEGTLARTRIKHYYGARLMQADLWHSIWSGKFAWRTSIQGLWNNLQRWHQESAFAHTEMTFQRHMALALRRFKGQVMLVLSDCDYTAKEFLECALTDAHWRGLLERPGLTRVDVADADHTFSKAVWRCLVEQAVLEWMTALEQRL